MRKASSGFSKDARRLFEARTVRSFAFGFMSVLFGIYLKETGMTPAAIGISLSVSILGGAVISLIAGRLATRFGIKRMFLASLLLSLTGIILFIASENHALMVAACSIAFISPSGDEMGPFLPLEQALLPFTVSAAVRTKAFSYLSILATLAASLGSLAAAFPTYLQATWGLSKMSSLKVMIGLYLAINLAALAIYAGLAEVQFEGRSFRLTQHSRKIVTRLSLLFSVDSFGGGLVIASIISLWFYTRFGVSLATISTIFFAAGILETVSYYLSGKLADKIGLINTMVFTHIPSNMFLIALPFMPTFALAAACYVMRFLLSEMDIPARQSYVVAVVEPGERPIASSVTTVSKLVASSLSAPIAVRLLLGPLSPFVIAGVLKTVYDLTLYFNFRHLRAPEEGGTGPPDDR